MYELDESLLAPGGSQVQCTKCQHVFTAVPPAAPGRTLVGVPAQAPAESAAQPAPGREPAPERPATPARPSASPARAASAAPRPDGAPARVARTSAPPVYRPPASSAPAVTRAPVLKRDTVGTFEARLRWAARLRWLAPALAVVVAAGIAAAWLLLRDRPGAPAGARAHKEALALLALDDAESLEAAAARLGDLERTAPAGGAAAADRALARVLRAASLGEERDTLAVRLSARNDERERLRREAPQGWEELEQAAARDVAALEPQVRALEEQVRALAGGAAERLGALRGEVGDTPEVVRATAALHALRGEREPLQKLVRTAREGGGRDAWLDLADGWMDARDPDRPTRERAVVRLGAVTSARPDLLRARYLLARAEASLGRRAEALATLDGVLSANPRHGAARRLQSELAAPPPPPPAPPAPAAPPAAKAPPPQRKPVPQAGPTPSSPAPTATAPSGPGREAPAPAAAAAPAASPPPAPPPPPAQVAPAPVPAPAPVEAAPPPPASAAPRAPRAPSPSAPSQEPDAHSGG
jgi:hypothetical protein